MNNIETILADELSRLQQDIITRQEQAGQIATGKTRESFSVKIINSTTAELEVPSYLEILQSGRGPGAIPADFKDILSRWVQAKGLTFSKEADFNRWAYFVSKKIREEGTTLYRSGQTLDIYSTPIMEFEERLTSRISHFYYTEFINQLPR